MVQNVIYLLFCVFFVLTNDVQGAMYSDLEDVVTTLFSNYQKELRPFDGDGQATSVYIGVRLASIKNLDEIEQALTMTAFLHTSWTDTRLAWNPADYNFTFYFAYPQKLLWVPDLNLMNSAESFTELGYDRNYLYVQFTGNITWIVSGVYKTSCDIDVTYYPFDTQVCSLIFSTIVTSMAEINLLPQYPAASDLSLYSTSGSWDLLSFTVTNGINPSVSKSYVIFNIKMKRRITYYVIAIIVPVLFLSLTATLVFALPADSGEKMGTSITVLLAFAVYLTIVSDQMPKTSNTVSILSLFLSMLLGQTSLGVIMSVWILNLHFRDDDQERPGQRMQYIAFNMKRLMCKISSRTQVRPVNYVEGKCPETQKDSLVDNPNQPPSEEPAPITFKVRPSSTISSSHQPADASFSQPETMSWKEVAVTFDRFLFYTFSVLLAASTFICLTILMTGS